MKTLVVLDNWVVKETRVILWAQASYKQKYNKKKKFRNVELRNAGTSCCLTQSGSGTAQRGGAKTKPASETTTGQLMPLLW